MAKEESGRLLSKVAKFVRNPLKDWSELDAPESLPADNGYSREMLKEMIERRQRNDFVRRREFDMLRKLRQREAAGGTPEGAAAISSFNMSTSGKSEGRALTLKKIDEIEEQMSQQWWKGRAPGSGDAPAVPPPAGSPEAPPADDEAARRAQAYADTEPGLSPQAAAAMAMAREGAHPSGLEDAAIRFAQGDDAGAEAVLLQMTAPESPQADHNEVWRALLDLYRATGDAEKFGAASTRYAQRFKRPGPEWISLRSLARDAQASHDARPVQPSGAADLQPTSADWTCPRELLREGLAELTRALANAGPVWHMDWRSLAVIDHDAAAPLRALFNHWADSPVQLRFAGASQLLAVLEKAAPTGDRSVDVVWWQLRMAVLRTLHEADAYELAALNYCITFEVSPPAWVDPRGSYASTDDEAAPPVQAYSEPSRASLVGHLGGDCQHLLVRLDAELKNALMPTVSCDALLRVDLEGARALVDWVAGHEEQGRRIEFVDAHRLVASFFHVTGITDHASVSIRSK